MGAERTPWGLGLATLTIAAVLTAAAVGSLGAALVRINVVLAAALLVVMIGGAAPTVMRRRREPVWRWLVRGAAAGTVVGLVVTVIAAF